MRTEPIAPSLHTRYCLWPHALPHPCFSSLEKGTKAKHSMGLLSQGGQQQPGKGGQGGLRLPKRFKQHRGSQQHSRATKLEHH